MGLNLLAFCLSWIVDPIDASRTEVFECVVTQDDSNKVAAKEVKEEMVPPALPEVG